MVTGRRGALGPTAASHVLMGHKLVLDSVIIPCQPMVETTVLTMMEHCLRTHHRRHKRVTLMLNARVSTSGVG